MFLLLDGSNHINSTHICIQPSFARQLATLVGKAGGGELVPLRGPHHLIKKSTNPPHTIWLPSSKKETHESSASFLNPPYCFSHINEARRKIRFLGVCVVSLSRQPTTTTKEGIDTILRRSNQTSSSSSSWWWWMDANRELEKELEIELLSF